jgi:oxygen-independent coproporphyrinogen-3 oxidase
MPLGFYISVPFCRTKCTYCNFASDVFSRALFEKYVSRLCAEIEQSRESCARMDAVLDPQVDSIYFGGGTPTLLDVTQLQRIFVTVRQNFKIQPGAEITVEGAPGTVSAGVLEAFVELGVNRVSLGVQSFVDQEARLVGRLHSCGTVVADIARLRAAGISNINVDLIAGLPHQTPASWEQSLDQLIASGVPHASVYMLEVDDDSRLGRELIAGGQRYHAHFVPDEDLTADLYERACERLNMAGVQQYEVSNFARAGLESRHNLKYWTRQPYLGFGVDAHSMLRSNKGEGAVRLANPDSVEQYVAGVPFVSTVVSAQNALEETFFLGLRLNGGVDIGSIAEEFGDEMVSSVIPIIDALVEEGLLKKSQRVLQLTRRGRMLSNEVFERFIQPQCESVSR